ncbi:MAG: disulfide bond chaperone [Akkermansiaceae bacterium]|nr:disulfide bond chaperone [Akkermansiaceae bacterium]NNM31098.1 disulfide bond chaperone [Akkermansiaceae bacterium]
MQHGLRYPQTLDHTLKELLAMLTLHLVARPWAETIAWTVNLRAPRVNFFATGASLDEQVTGRLFTDDVREPARALFYQQITVPDREPRLSTIEIDGTDPLVWTEALYRQSEQRPGRAFRLPDENYVLLAAQPDFDPEWLESLDEGQVAEIDRQEEIKLLEKRRFKWHCGCTLERILPALGMWREKPDELFQGEDHIILQCPRCAAKFEVTRDMI